MALSDEQLVAILKAELDPLERTQGVAYYSDRPLRAGSNVPIPRKGIEVPWNAMLAFIDREPLANWSHSCRYILINRESGQTMSIDAQLPPFRRNDEHHWAVAYKASSVPDTVLAVHG